MIYLYIFGAVIIYMIIKRDNKMMELLCDITFYAIAHNGLRIRNNALVNIKIELYMKLNYLFIYLRIYVFMNTLRSVKLISLIFSVTASIFFFSGAMVMIFSSQDMVSILYLICASMYFLGSGTDIYLFIKDKEK